MATSTVDGTVKSSNLYEAYGNIVLSTGSSDNNRLANTKERDFSIGLDNHGRRYFDPETGRYINPDPIGYGDGPNWWVYVQNNPINFIDPLGLGGGNATPRVQPKPQPQPQPKPGPVIPERNSVGPYRVTGEVFLGNLTQARVDAELYEIHRHNAANLRSGTVREEYEMRERELEIREEESQYGIPSPARSRRASDAFGKAKEVSQSRPPVPLEARSSQYRSSRPASNTDMFANARDLPTKEQIRTGRSAEPEWARGAPSYEQYRAALAGQNDGRTTACPREKSAVIPLQGRYEFPDQSGDSTPYVGQSGNVPRRLDQHEAAGRYKPGTATTTEVLGGKTAREISEHRRIQELTGGVPAKESEAVTNKVDPIGPKRQHLLNE